LGLQTRIIKFVIAHDFPPSKQQDALGLIFSQVLHIHAHILIHTCTLQNHHQPHPTAIQAAEPLHAGFCSDVGSANAVQLAVKLEAAGLTRHVIELGQPIPVAMLFIKSGELPFFLAHSRRNVAHNFCQCQLFYHSATIQNPNG